MFPKSLAEVVSHYRVQEPHLSLTQGKWRTRVWGYPPISSPPGAEFWTWFLPDTEYVQQVLLFTLSSDLYGELNVYRREGEVPDRGNAFCPSVFILITELLDCFFLIPFPLCTIAKYDKLSKIVSYLLVPPSSVSVLGAMYKQMFTNWGITSVT